MKLKINWKELGKQLWNAVRCAAESEAFGGKPRRLRLRCTPAETAILQAVFRPWRG